MREKSNTILNVITGVTRQYCHIYPTLYPLLSLSYREGYFSQLFCLQTTDERVRKENKFADIFIFFPYIVCLYASIFPAYIVVLKMFM